MSTPRSVAIARAVGLSVALTIVYAAGRAGAQEEVPPPPPPDTTTVVVVEPLPTQHTSTVTETRSNRKAALITSGALTFGVSYGAAAIVAATSERPSDERLYVPLIGPWLDLADRGDCAVAEASCDPETTNKVLLVVDGVLQGAGLLAVIIGIVTPETSSQSSSSSTSVSSRIHVAPVDYGRGSPGLVVFGRF